MKMTRIMGEDGPPGQCTDLIIGYGGNHDWYIGVEGPQFPEFAGDAHIRERSNMARFCTSGGRFHAVTHMMAMLYHVGQGDYESAADMIDGLRGWLTDERTRRPDPDEADRAFRDAIANGTKSSHGVER